MAREKIATGRPFEQRVLHGAGIVASGRFLFTSGVTARNPEGEVVAAGDMQGQVRQVFANLALVLAAAGADISRVVKYTIYVTDMQAYQAARAAWAPGMVDHPASTLVEVRRLAHPDMMVEVEAIVALE